MIKALVVVVCVLFVLANYSDAKKGACLLHRDVFGEVFGEGPCK